MTGERLLKNYPKHRIADIGLLDGSTMRVRPVKHGDLAKVEGLFGRLSDESIRLRFHGSRRIASRDMEELILVDHRTKAALVAERMVAGELRILALATYVKTDPGKAEMSIVVDDASHGIGLGSLMVEHLCEAAEEAGIDSFEAEVLGDNFTMLDVIRRSELPLRSTASAGVVHVEFPTTPTVEALEAFEQREAMAAAASVRIFLEPRSVAVIGASRREGTIGGELFRNLLSSSFTGALYAVNPNTDLVWSLPAYPNVGAIPDQIDLAVVVVPASAVLAVARDCGESGVRGLVVISSGFAEVGKTGARLQNELLELARLYGMRIIGPNCMGLMNPQPHVSMNATFAPVRPAPGNVAFSSQSGALGVAIIDAMDTLGLGMSGFVSVGNKADISGNDLLQYWEQDPSTEVILLYLESFGNPRRFARIARRVSRQKPIVAVKSGRSRAGARAAASHTGSLAAGDVAVDALFRQAGVIRTDTLEELFDVASLLAHQPLPRGKRVGILTNGGGLGILAADACEAAGLMVPDLSPGTRNALRSFLPQEASVANPVDMIASATAEHYGSALKTMAADPHLDSLIVIFIPPLVTKAEEVAAALRESSAAIDKTILACFMGTQGIHEDLHAQGRVIPSFAFPESAARALAQASTYSAWRSKPEGLVPRFEDVDRAKARRIVSDVVSRGDEWMRPDEVSELLEAYGLRSARSVMVANPGEVAAAAGELDGPVALKVRSRDVLHKTDVGGVRLGLDRPAEAAAAAKEMEEALSSRGVDVEGFLVQEMIVGTGAELFVGVTLDPIFGPLIACGAGGTMVELIRDVAVRITPLTDAEAGQMLRSLRTFPILEGFRGSPRLDIEAAEDLLLRISSLVEDLPQLQELDLNPVRLLTPSRGCVVLDARGRVEPVLPAPPRGARLKGGSRPRRDR